MVDAHAEQRGDGGVHGGAAVAENVAAGGGTRPCVGHHRAVREHSGLEWIFRTLCKWDKVLTSTHTNSCFVEGCVTKNKNSLASIVGRKNMHI